MQFHGDCCIYKLNPPLMPKKVQERMAEISDLLIKPPDKHNRGRDLEEPLTEEELMRDNKESVKAIWSHREKEHFVSICKKFIKRYKNKNKIEFLKKIFPNKQRGDIVKYYYIVKEELKKKQKEKH